MDPQKRFCHNERCWAYGRAGEGHIVIHSQKEQRYRCKRCSKTFSATKGTALYRMHKPHALVATVVTLLAYGCPPQAIVAAFGLDERPIYRGQLMSGRQCRRLHEHIVQAGGVLLAQVQADELRVRVVGGVVWLASALSVSSRLWLGGVVQIRRDRTLIRKLLEGVRACGTFEALLLCTDGLAGYPKQALKVFSEPLRTGKVGRPRLLLPEGLMVAQAIKRYARRRVIGVLRRVVRGTEEAVEARLYAGEPKRGDQHCLHRAASSHLALPAGPAGEKDPGGGSSREDACGGHVADRDGLQLLLLASLSKVAGGWRGQAAAMDRENSGPSGGTHRSSLVALRAARLGRPSDSTQAARETTEMVVGGCSWCLTARPRLDGVLPVTRAHSPIVT